MNDSALLTSSWYQSLTLKERLTIMRSYHILTTHNDTEIDRGEQRLQLWKSQYPFINGNYFAQRLAAGGLTETELLYLLGKRPKPSCSNLPITIDWLEHIYDVLDTPPSTKPLQSILNNQETSELLIVLAPFLTRGREQLRHGINKLIQMGGHLPFDPDNVGDLLLPSLARQLVAQTGRTLALELQIARLQGILEGDTAQARFCHFVRGYSESANLLRLLEEYPVLSRQLVNGIQQWVNTGLEFLQRLVIDWGAICVDLMGKSEPGLLTALDSSAGDRHRGGRSVIIAQFSSGIRVVYKPHSLAVDVHFQQLLQWLNEHGAHPAYYTLKVLDRGNYGWVEFVTTAECKSTEEIRRFYERQGGYLALLSALKATDFHYENLIAKGEHPILLDLEALFHPRPDSLDLRQADDIANSILFNSVLSVGMLPQRLWSNKESDGIDLSGLGGEGGQLTPHSVLHIEAAGTDEMRFVRKRLPMPGARNRPSLEGVEIDALAYMDAVVEGFERIYSLLLEHRLELLAEDGPIARFAYDEVRVILRPTNTYALLLQESFHPDVLRDSLDRERLLDHLWAIVPHRSYLAPVILAEQADLQNGDIPYFSTRPVARSLWTSAKEVVDNFFAESGISLVRHGLEELSSTHLSQQVWIIRAALSTTASQFEHIPRTTADMQSATALADRDFLLRAAHEVGGRIEALALRSGQEATWLGLTLTPHRNLVIAPLQSDLYDGLPGIALFLAYLSAITSEERYRFLAQAALATLRRQLAENREQITIGGYTGWGGVIYLLTHLAVLWQEPELFTEAETIVELLPLLIEQDEELDMIGGVAGCLRSLITLYRCKPTETVLSVARQCGEHLLARVQTMPQGSAWINRTMGEQPLTGAGHGAAGIACTLLELSVLTSEERFRSMALAALVYERSQFLPEANNWADLRDSTFSGQGDGHGCMVAWCHGAPGIGLARLSSLPYLQDAGVETEIDVALKTTLAKGFGSNHSLCHGDLGNLDFLLSFAFASGDSEWWTKTYQMAAAVLASREENGWVCGVPLGIETPGLMTGLAGIGYELLRLAAPSRIPSVLMLEPPLLATTTTMAK